MIGEVSRAEIENLYLNGCTGCRASGEQFATLNGQIIDPDGARRGQHSRSSTSIHVSRSAFEPLPNSSLL
jgi:hypothetical protein